MAAPRWRSTPVIDDLHDAPYRYEFHQAVRLLELARASSGQPVEALGATASPNREAVRIESDPSLGFPPSDIVDIDAPPEKREGDTSPQDPVAMRVSFMGLAGAHGPLPKPFTERILERLQKRDRGMAAFLDIFNHRLASIMYRLRVKNRVGLENLPPENSSAGRMLFAFAGFGQAGLRQRQQVPDASLLAYAGLLTGRGKTSEALRRILSDYFKVPVVIKENCGSWIDLPKDEVTRLGLGRAEAPGQCAVLGRNATVGGRFWDQSAGVEIGIGPVPLDQFQIFLPNGSAHGALVDLCKLVLGPHRRARLRLLCAKDDIPEPRLGFGARLGWTSWLAPTEPESNQPEQSDRPTHLEQQEQPDDQVLINLF